MADITDTIPSDACIYDLSRFLSILSLYNDPDVEFMDKYFIISEGKRRTKYVYADLSMIHTPPEKEITIPTADVTVTVTGEELSTVQKAAGVLQFSEIAFVGEGGKCYLRAIDSANSNADDFGVEIGETDDTFNIIIKTDNLKLMPMDYEVTLCSKGISQFKGKGVTYYVAIDSKSTYKKGE
ncbi:MAG: DNA polymerase [Methylophagaceae bacterium]